MPIQLKLDNLFFIMTKMTKAKNSNRHFSSVTELSFLLVNLLCRKTTQINFNSSLFSLETHPSKNVLKYNVNLSLSND